LEKVERVSPWGMCREKRRRCVIRGGGWANGASAGVFSFDGNYSRAHVGWSVGFRSALALFVIVCGLRLSRNSKAKGTHFPADKAKDQRSRGLLAKVARGGGQTAEAGRSLVSG
ncbi:MAG: hypothetical protein K2P22_03185, partial [Lachnospiraceae bacterium]|nr:hypothetical protein [Lachnospiraceae bacterium]